MVINLKLKVLMDNTSSIQENKALSEHGLSFYLESLGKRILFDTGYSDAIINNAQVFNIDLNNLDYIILSHAHNDHSRGLQFLLEHYDLSNTILLAHPDIFLKRKDEENNDVGISLNEKEIAKKMKVLLTDEPYFINDELTFLGQIKRTNDYEALEPMGYFQINQYWYEDYLNDDTCIVYHKNDELTIISGCSHSGISNMFNSAIELYPNSCIKRVVGGLRLFEVDDKLYKTKDCMLANKVEELYPCHCVSFKAMAYLNNYIPCFETYVGSEYEWD